MLEDYRKIDNFHRWKEGKNSEIGQARVGWKSERPWLKDKKDKRWAWIWNSQLLGWIKPAFL